MTAREITSEPETGLSLKELMLLPVILLWLTFQVFARHVVTLKQMRRTRPLPINWREHYERLRIVEWRIRELTTSGVEQILSGRELDLTDLWGKPDPPEDFGAMPASAWEMHRRFEAIARVHADPERYIRRAAERILAREGGRDLLGRADPRPPAAVVVIVTSFAPSRLSLPHAPHQAQRIRAPPLACQKFRNRNPA
jgi:hypothetical protein